MLRHLSPFSFPLASKCAGEKGLKEKQAQIRIITGPRGVGKSSYCQTLVDSLREIDKDPVGIISLSRIQGGKKTGIFLEDLAAGETRLLAIKGTEPSHSYQVGCWYFDETVLDWGNQVLERIIDPDILIIDELGPLEFERGGGFQAGLTLLDKGRFQTAYVVVRPELLGSACGRWPEAEVVEIERGYS